MSKLVSRPPVDKLLLDSASTNIGLAAWVELTAATQQPSNGVEIFNGTGSILKVATGPAGQEVEMAYYILPGGSGILLDFSIAKSVRVAVKAVDVAATNGILILNLFG